MDKVKNYILFIGMGDWDIPQLSIAREEGFHTIVTNKNADAEALKQADIAIIVDGRDVYSILSELYEKQVQHKIASIYTGTELFLTVAILSKILGLPGNSPESAYGCEKKHCMREAFQSANIMMAEGFSANSLAEVKEKIQWEKGVYIIKPSDSLSSQGVSVVSHEDELSNSVNLALSFSTSKKIICERYIDGSLHDINGVLTEDGFIRLGINDKKAGPLPYAVVIEGKIPTALTVAQQNKLYVIFEKACRSIGLSHGPVKADYILDHQGNFYLMEVAPRLHGPLGSLYLIPNALSINPLRELLRWVKADVFKQHDVNGLYSGVVCQAVVSYEDKPINSDDIIKILTRKGVDDKKKWTSNNDIPCYVISRC